MRYLLSAQFMKYDPFQQQAIDVINREESLIVSAPTGAGKTLIAEYAIEQALAQNAGAIYTAPIKALSNQKYRDFSKNYGERIGILTGDVAINPDAPILIMTTEIYRNSLFEPSPRFQHVKWVIFDEVHYLDDWERGTVWEEALMFAPASVRLLCLSATVPNIDQIAEWMKVVLERKVNVIKEDRRPVPLVHYFQCQGQVLDSPHKLLKQGYMGKTDWSRDRYNRHSRMFTRALPNRIDKLIAHLQSENRLPCIFFCFGRRRTEELASELSHFDFLNEEERKRIQSTFDTLCERYQIENEASTLNLAPLIERGIGYHHAGMLPTLKEVIEQLFTSKLIKLIFTTETFALGINMPARSVVFDELRKFYGAGFANLRTRDFYQMAGRAGRRGMDDKGFVYSRVNPHQTPYPEVLRMIQGKPEAIASQFNASYATLLNLYRRYGEKLFEIYPKSLHHFQAPRRKRERALDALHRKCGLLKEMSYIVGESLSEKGEFASCLYGYELLLSEMHEETFLDSLGPAALAVILSSLVYEPRKRDEHPHIPKHYKNFPRLMESYLRKIHGRETRWRIFPPTKEPHFELAPLIDQWTGGVEFDVMMQKSAVDEGELVRYFRMVIQLLRELRDAPHTSDTLKKTIRETLQLINRDIVDAERQLRM